MTITPEQVCKIADKHITMYLNRIKSKARHVNIVECQMYLSIWQGVKAKGGKELTHQELGELLDAISSGEFDDILKENRNG